MTSMLAVCVCNLVKRSVCVYSRTVTARFLSRNLSVTRPLLFRSFSISSTFYDYPKHKICKLPSLSPTMETGNLATWEKSVGDKLEEGDVIATIETDKAVMSVETPFVGYLAKILKPSNTKDIPVNDPIAIIVPKKEDIDAFKDYEAGESNVPKPVDEPPKEATTAVVQKPVSSSDDRIKASPFAKALAKDLHVDITTIPLLPGQERLVSSDIRKASVSVQAPTKAQVSQVSAQIFEDIPLSNIRKIIAKRLVESKQFIPHYYLTAQIEMDEISKLREQLNKKYSNKGIKLTFNDFVVKASSVALLRVPECNSSWMDTFIRRYTSTDISVAVSTDSGLFTPFLKGVERMGLADISAATKTLATKAREGKLQPDEFMGGTFTISNLGMYGISSFSAIINPPQSCILAVGSISKILAPVPNGEPVVKSVMNVTLSCDHRVVDGALGATWMREFKTLMENPIEMLY